MDPKVCGKLLTHHRRGYGVDVEALRDRIPLRQIAGKGPKMGSHGYRRLRRWKSGLKERFWWTGMKKDIAEYVAICDVCQRVKAEHQCLPRIFASQKFRTK